MSPVKPSGLTRRGLIGSAAAGTLGIAGAAMHATRDGEAGQEAAPAPDMILHNGRITTLDRARPEVEALVAAGGQVAALGPARG